MRTISIVGVVLVLAACTNSSTDADDGGCADISGNYKLTATKQTGTCSGSENGTASEDTVTIERNANGLFVRIPGLDGACPGSLEAATCRFTAQCVLLGKDDPSQKVGTFNIDYTFSGKTFSGSVNVGLNPPGKASCTELETHDGTRI